MRNKKKWTDADYRVKYFIAKLLHHYGCDITIIAAINSWKEELSAEDVEGALKHFESGKPLEIVASVFDNPNNN